MVAPVKPYDPELHYSPPRYSAAILIAWLYQKFPDLRQAGNFPPTGGRWSGDDEPAASILPPCELVGLTSSAWQDVKERGYVNTWLADEIATHLGIHPSRIWSSWYDDAVDEPVCEECGEPVPYNGTNAPFTCGPEHKKAREARRYQERRLRVVSPAP